MTIQEKNKINISQFPDYNCYVLQVTVHPTQENFDKNACGLQYYANFRSWLLNCSEYSILPRDYFSPAKYRIDDNDLMLFHPSCRIPKKLIIKGKVITDKSPEVPNCVVTPLDYYSNYLYNKPSMACNIITVNYQERIVLVLHYYLTTNEQLGGTPRQWLDLIKNPINTEHVKQDFGAIADGFVLYDGTRPQHLIGNLNDIDVALLSGMMPSKCVISESEIETGAEPITLDTLYSVYMMLKSPDDQVLETAFNWLANSRFMAVKNIIWWLLFPVKAKARSYKKHSTAFAWLYEVCRNRYSNLRLTQYKETDVARELIRKITNNGIDFQSDGSMIINNSSFLNDAQIRTLAQAAK